MKYIGHRRKTACFVCKSGCPAKVLARFIYKNLRKSPSQIGIVSYVGPSHDIPHGIIAEDPTTGKVIVWNRHISTWEDL